MIMFDIANHKPLRNLVYDSLKTQILTGGIRPGSRMLENELAIAMDVSRTPVREALRQLEKEGLVTITPRRGAYASSISLTDMAEILEVRQNMEGLAAFLAAKRITEGNMVRLKHAMDEYNMAIAEKDLTEMIRCDTVFHHIIVESCGNRILMQMIEQLQDVVLRFRYIYYGKYRREGDQCDEHDAIVKAIERGDAEAAETAASDHIDRLRRLIICEKEGLQ